MKTFTSVLFLRENSAAVTVTMSLMESNNHPRRQANRQALFRSQKKWYRKKLHNNTAVVIETTTVVTVAWVNVPNINARNTLDFIGLEYFFFLTLRTSWGDMMSGDGSFTLFHSATTFRVTFTFSYVHYLYSKAVYFHHLKWEYCNHGIPRLSLSLSHTHLCTLIHICMDNTCSFAVGELPKSS